MNILELKSVLNENKTESVKKDANWKRQFEIMWSNTPKKFRRTKAQINALKSKAKLYIELNLFNH